MAQRFNRAMELMGWRVPDEDEEVFEEAIEVVPTPEPAQVTEVQLHSLDGGRAHSEVAPARERAPRQTAIKRIVTVHPSSYADARMIGEALRDGTPVIINLTELADVEARRILDFAAGLVFGLRASIERVTPRVFLLSPQGVEVASKSEHRATDLF